MVLDAEHRTLLVTRTFDRAVVQIEVCDLHVLRQRLGIYRKAVILRGNLDLARPQFLDGMVRSAMAELQLERLRAHCQTKNLVAQADAKRRNTALGDRARVVDGVRERRRIARAIAEKDAIR